MKNTHSYFIDTDMMEVGKVWMANTNICNKKEEKNGQPSLGQTDYSNLVIV